MSHQAEFKLHTACIAYLYGEFGHGKRKLTVSRPFPDLFNADGRQRFTHIAQGRSKSEGGMLQQMGLRRGMLDLYLWPKCGQLWMDFKVDTRLSKDQEAFMWDMKDFGIPCYTPRSMQEFSDILKAHGVQRAHDMIIEPNLQTWDEKRDDAIAYFAP